MYQQDPVHFYVNKEGADSNLRPLLFHPIQMENKYKEGSVVCARVDPTLKLIIRRYIDRIYYCRVQSEPERKELVYFEREICEIIP